MNNNLNYIKERVTLGFKIAREYKANFYSGLLAHYIYTILNILFTLIILDLFSSIHLERVEIIFLFLHAQVMAMLSQTFTTMRLKEVLIRGDLSTYSSKPLSPKMKYTFDFIAYFGFFYVLIDLILLIIFGVYFDLFEISRYLLVFLMSIPGFIMYFSIYRFLDSTAFFIKDNRFLRKSYYQVDILYNKYPLILFDGILFKLGFFIGYSLYGLLPIFYYFNKISFEIILNAYFYIFPFTIMIIIFTYLLWHYGLKKYEAFG